MARPTDGRPSIDTRLLPLAATSQAAPSAEALSRIETGTCCNPFADISSDSRLARWARSIHVFPAARPRSIAASAHHQPRLPDYPPSLNRSSIVQNIRAQNRLAQRRSHQATPVDEPQLFIVAARYFIPAASKSDPIPGETIPNKKGEPLITFILSHANGLHKETWEPFLAHLILSPGGRNIQEVWALDCVHHGDSALLNRDTLGLNFDWADHARDLLNFVLSYLPDQDSHRSSLPTVLPVLECANGRLLELDGWAGAESRTGPKRWRGRRVGLIGHSFGGCVSMLAAASIPGLFEEVILVDPVIRPTYDCEADNAMAGSAATRHSHWPNRTIALQNFEKKRTFFGRWDPLVLKRYVQHALVEESSPSGPVTLKCNKLHEACVFTEPHNRRSGCYYRMMDMIQESLSAHPQVDTPGGPSLPFRLFVILGNRAQSVVPEEAIPSGSCKLRCVARLDQAGHLIVQETPMQLASLISNHLTQPSPLSYPNTKPKSSPVCKL